MKKKLLALAIFFTIFYFSFSETIIMKDGSVLKGTIKSMDENTIILITSDYGELKVNRKNVENIIYKDNEENKVKTEPEFIIPETKSDKEKNSIGKDNKLNNINFNLTDDEKDFYDTYIVNKWKIDLNQEGSKQILLNKEYGFLAGGLFLSIFGSTVFTSGIIVGMLANGGLPAWGFLFDGGLPITIAGAIITPLCAIPFWFCYYINNIYEKTYGAKVSFNGGYNFINKSIALNISFNF